MSPAASGVHPFGSAPGRGEGVIHDKAAVHSKCLVQHRDALLQGGGEGLLEIHKLQQQGAKKTRMLLRSNDWAEGQQCKHELPHT